MKEAKFKPSFVTAIGRIRHFSNSFWKTLAPNRRKVYPILFLFLLKNIRNLRLTEKTQQLEFSEYGSKFVASWHHLKDLFKSESGNLVKQS